MEDDYEVVVKQVGCKECGSGDHHVIVFHKGKSDEFQESVSYDNSDDAADVCTLLNRAYKQGFRDGRSVKT